MSRYIIVSVPGAATTPPNRLGDFTADREPQAAVGCAWLFSAIPVVDDPERALRAAVGDFFDSPEGQRVRNREGLESFGWCEAIPWIPDELWQRHGLTVFRHPDVERIILHEEEDLAEDLTRPAVEKLPAAAP